MHFAANHCSCPGNQNKPIWLGFFFLVEHAILWPACRCAGSPSVAISGTDACPGRPQRRGVPPHQAEPCRAPGRAQHGAAVSSAAWKRPRSVLSLWAQMVKCGFWRAGSAFPQDFSSGWNRTGLGSCSRGAEQCQGFPKPGRASPPVCFGASAAALAGAGRGPRDPSHVAEGLNKGSLLKHGIS